MRPTVFTPVSVSRCGKLREQSPFAGPFLHRAPTAICIQYSKGLQVGASAKRRRVMGLTTRK